MAVNQIPFRAIELTVNIWAPKAFGHPRITVMCSATNRKAT